MDEQELIETIETLTFEIEYLKKMPFRQTRQETMGVLEGRKIQLTGQLRKLRLKDKII